MAQAPDQSGYRIDPDDLPFFASEKRLHIRAFRHWERLLDGTTLPAAPDTDDADFAPFADYFCHIDLTGDSDRIVATGAKLAAVSGGTYAGWTPASVPDELLLGRVLRHIDEVLEAAAPVGLDAELDLDTDLVLPFRAILLPFAAQGTALTSVIAVVSWKETVIEQSGYTPLASNDGFDVGGGPGGDELLEDMAALIADEAPDAPVTTGHSDSADAAALVAGLTPLTPADQQPADPTAAWLLLARPGADGKPEIVGRLDVDAPDLVAEAVRRTAQKRQAS
ncbi:hypothetical protein EV659_11119 [Rhodothalassium salexigens DSM 2132]|uniref:PAS domain-containing protein n=1 Tax=Rhodothalassium salexigens DSM 2132 TaxID=1188247 RepID=A0A4R2PBF8_RHOSA|nr:hypothetical protein [Rhodothalassium salexigens]MBB4212509.1 hypothetical protein [Rhodothalassium salexigens DSM 2132]MBK1638478.1 hypothetical protein [Rhodothalassium salexigens DSM 2132]TCP31451.1 hypothetical protein EV659_11119 [Rhodothalassium salexigens DSM 2132]